MFRSSLGLVAIASSMLAMTLGQTDARAGTLLLTSCAGRTGFSDYGFPDGSTWVFATTPDATAFEQSSACNAGRSFKIIANTRATLSEYAQWSTTSPPAVEMTGAFTPAKAMLVNPTAVTNGYNFRFGDSSGWTNISEGSSCCGGLDYAGQINKPLSGRWFGIQVTCNNPNGCIAPNNVDLIDIPAIEISAVDTTPPALAATGATNLFNATTGWVRGVWPMPFQASADDGVCHLATVIGGAAIQGPAVTPDDHMWMQCKDPLAWADSVDTGAYPNGALSVQLNATDAASPANVATASRTVHVDNTPVTLSLSGPNDWLSTDGPASIRATASAGPSGLAGIWCSVDGSPQQRYAGPTATIPIAGIGDHIVSCETANNAVAANGAAAKSPMQNLTLGIRQPSVSTVSFTAIADALRCHQVKERVRIRARWVTARSHGHKVRVRLPAETRTVKVTRCKPRIVHRRVRVRGHWYTESFVVLPHKVKRTVVRASFGSRVTVNGWLGTTGGNAVAKQRVTVMAARDAPRARFTEVGVTMTRRDGSWTAVLPPGPSRKVKVVYAGSSTVEPATSPAARVIVPASVKLALSTRSTPWGDTVEISGRLRGCCVPPDGELVSLHISWPGGSAAIGQVYARHGGRFRTPYTFLRGTGTATYRVWATTAAESDYPYAVGASPRLPITVSSGS
jgi:hypothetical protein